MANPTLVIEAKITELLDRRATALAKLAEINSQITELQLLRTVILGMSDRERAALGILMDLD